MKDLERYRKCSSVAQLSFRLITEKISKHTWKSKMSEPGKFCRDLKVPRVHLEPDFATAIVFLYGRKDTADTLLG